jgi:hypothetical protein
MKNAVSETKMHLARKIMLSEAACAQINRYNEKEDLRKMNHALHDIQVLTYNDLIRRGKNAISTTDFET